MFQKVARPLQPDFLVILGRPHIDFGLKGTLQLLNRNRQAICDSRYGNGVLVRPFQLRHRIKNKLIPDACPQAQLQAFAIRRRTDAVMDKPFGNLPDQIFTVMAADDFQHHVKRPDAAGPSESCAIDDLNASCQCQAWKGFGKRGLAAPMKRAGIAIKQAGPPEIEGAIRNASYMRAVAQIFLIQLRGDSADILSASPPEQTTM